MRLLQETSAEALERAAGDAELLERAAGIEAVVQADLARARHRPDGAGRHDRVLLGRVRAARLAADLLRRPRRAGRRHPQGGLRPRAAARGRRPALPPGLLPPAHRRLGLAARVLGRHRPRARAGRARARRRRRAGDDHGADLGPRRDRAGVARGRRARAAVPARRRAPGERPDRPLDHVAAVRRRTSACGSPSTRCWGSAACGRWRRCGSTRRSCTSTRATRRSSRSSWPAARRRRHDARGRAGDRPPAHGVHDPHARAGRQRHLPAGAVASSCSARSPSDLGVEPDAARAARAHVARRGRRAVRRHAVRAAHEPRRQRRQPPPRRGRARDVAGDVAGPRRRRRPDHLRHQRRAPAELGGRAAARAARPPPRRGLARPRRRTRRPGPRSTTSPDEELWAARNAQRATLVDFIRTRSAIDRLGRDEPLDYAEAAATAGIRTC